MRANPRITEAFSLYDNCRIKQLVVQQFQIEGGRIETRGATFPAGYGPLPFPGGWLDQPVFIVHAFENFMKAERHVAARNLSGR